MISTVTYTRRPLWLRILRPFAVWSLKGAVSSAEAYLRDARNGGVLNAAQLAELDRNIEPIRVLHAWWRNQ